MSIDEPVIPILIVDGQEVYVPGYETWKELSQTRRFQGRRIFGDDYADLVAKHLDLVRRYPEFFLGFRGVPALLNNWFILMLLKTQAGPQRVAIEWVTCKRLTVEKNLFDRLQNRCTAWQLAVSSAVTKIDSIRACDLKVGSHQTRRIKLKSGTSALAGEIPPLTGAELDQTIFASVDNSGSAVR